MAPAGLLVFLTRHTDLQAAGINRPTCPREPFHSVIPRVSSAIARARRTSQRAVEIQLQRPAAALGFKGIPSSEGTARPPSQAQPQMTQDCLESLVTNCHPLKLLGAGLGRGVMGRGGRAG